MSTNTYLEETFANEHHKTALLKQRAESWCIHFYSFFIIILFLCDTNLLFFRCKHIAFHNSLLNYKNNRKYVPQHCLFNVEVYKTTFRVYLELVKCRNFNII